LVVVVGAVAAAAVAVAVAAVVVVVTMIIIVIMIRMLMVPIRLLLFWLTFTTTVTFYIVSRSSVQSSVMRGGGVDVVTLSVDLPGFLGFVHSPVYRNIVIEPDVSETRYQGLKLAISNGPKSVGASPTFDLRTQTETLFSILFLYF
jgi:hypothetical protein